ncbi:preprotein translocase subunit YajC [Acidithiobacillus sulfurivorans]|uniref:Sec translocon accessory complex subunit YajC n=1 Tax=Acidithiobacillus sulfurivorans TaxID=1958756 RepID=A0ABS5ZWR7_9PROT|nr:preprotein translocase subunit YajC [Acidithiobacillus sulfurivorans]MBU2759485.1 preprotein translocase subunit YajC [Acidithiobacillus sulfurivorans]
MSFSPIANAYAGTAAGGGSDSGLIMIVYILVFGAIIYFMMIRPQMRKSKEQRQLMASISKGDEVVTVGGLAGRVMQLGDEYLHIEVAEGITVKVQKAAVTLLLPKGTLKKL